MLSDWRILCTLNPSIRRYLVIWALLGFGYFGIQGVLLNLYLIRLGFGAAFIGLLIASGQIIWAAAALPGAAIGRRFGLRAALIAACTLCTLGMVLLLMVEALPAPIWAIWLFGCWALMWFGVALLTVNSTPYLMQISSLEERNHAFAAQSAVMALMGFLGSVIAGVLPNLFVAWFGGSLGETAPYRYALWLTPLAYTVCIFLWAGARQAHWQGETEAAPTSAKPLGLFIFFGLVVFLQTAGEGSVRAFFNVYLDKTLGVPTAQIGTIFGAGQLLAIPAALVVPGLLRRSSTTLTLAGSTLGMGVTLVLLAAFPHWFPATLGFIGMMAMSSVNGPARSIFSQEIVALRWRTTTSAITTIGLALGWASAAAAGGYMAAHGGFSGLFSLSAGLAFVATLLLFSYLVARAKRARLVTTV
jgi:MFS family permease